MKIKIKYFLLGSFSTVLLLPISLMIIGKERVKNSYYILSSYLDRKIENKSNFSEKDFSSCLPDTIESIPINASLVIGHAYGRSGSRKERDTLSPKIDKLLEENKNNIDTLFLTGDVFKIPSLEKWENLYQKYEKYFDIYIAPGNHDVVFPYRDLFTLYIGKKQLIKFPFLVKKAGFNIVIDDSNIKDTILESSFKIERLNKLDGDIIFLRHHVLIDKLSSYGGMNMSLRKKELFEKKLKHNNDVYFIYGNGGMRKEKPRIACYKHKNFTHLLNGIGEFDDDYIIVLSNKKILRYQVKN